jgi:hypothetical protein
MPADLPGWLAAAMIATLAAAVLAAGIYAWWPARADRRELQRKPAGQDRLTQARHRSPSPAPERIPDPATSPRHTAPEPERTAPAAAPPTEPVRRPALPQRTDTTLAPAVRPPVQQPVNRPERPCDGR